MDDPDYNPLVPAHVPAARVYDFNMLDHETQDPFQAIDELFKRHLPEVFWTRNLGGHWLVMGIDAISELNESAPTLLSAKRLLVPDRQNADTPSFPPNDTDPPLHSAYRSVIGPLFAPHRIDAMRDDIRAVTRMLIAGIKMRGECEFMEDFAAQMPVNVFLKLLDLPIEDRPKLRAIAHRIMNPIYDDNLGVPLGELTDYLMPHIKDRMARPRQDAISHVVCGRIGDRPLELEEIGKLTRSLVVAGLDTMAGMLGYFARYLAETPTARRRVIAQPEIIPKMVEELLRRFPVSNIGRYLTHDMVFRGVQMKAGEHIVWPSDMYNFDERRFPNPLSVQFGRPNNRHATFGLDHHFCAGAVLARTELRIFTEEWLREIPDFRVKPGANIAFRGGLTKVYKALPMVLADAACSEKAHPWRSRVICEAYAIPAPSNGVGCDCGGAH